MYELIITEKPKAAQRIAEALAEKTPTKESQNKVPFYKIKHKGNDIVVASTVGHIFGLAEREKGKWTYPVYDIEWKPMSEVNKKGDFTKKYAAVLKKLTKNATSFTVATDYDTEGEVIGLNCIKYICKQKDASRMKFSTLTKPDLIKAYENKSSSIDWGLAIAGETRHMLDWFYGINMSRALTSAIKKAGIFKILSAGRVQGPALKILVDRELEIKAFKPDPYWMIELEGKAKNGNLLALHKEDKIFDKKRAEEILKKTKGKDAKVENLEKSEFVQHAPYPFDLTTLQTESFRCFRINPKQTLSLAQELYTAGLISYPRTSSQQLPPAIGYKKIIENISKQTSYKELCNQLLKQPKLMPIKGKKTDPAHPAIYPTGIVPKNLKSDESKLYELIVRRFLAAFGESAKRLTLTITINCNEEMFITKGTTTIFKGWHVFYGSFARFKEEELPLVEVGEPITVKEIRKLDKETEPPKRYTQASIVRELEKKNLGTKSTRAQIVDTLIQRNYVLGARLEATELGIHTIETLEKYIPKIIDQKMTRHFEEEMEEIREKKKKKEIVLEEAKVLLTAILKDFKKKEKEIGEGLISATKESEKKERTIGKCPNCEDGELQVKQGKFGRFAACSKHPDCKTTFSLPNTGMVKVGEKICEDCQHPEVTIIRKRKKPQDVCINPKCPKKHVDETNIEEKTCPKCKEGKMVLRKSVYGAFLACNRYPKCRSTENLDGNKKKS